MSDDNKENVNTANDIFDRYISYEPCEADIEEDVVGDNTDEKKVPQMKYVEIDSEDEGQEPTNIKVKAKREQFNLITKAMNGNTILTIVDLIHSLKKIVEHDESLMDANQLDELWNDLAVRLDSLGPPTFTKDQWIKKWGAHKYNVYSRKRKHSENVLLNRPIPAKISRKGSFVHFLICYFECFKFIFIRSISWFIELHSN